MLGMLALAWWYGLQRLDAERQLILRNAQAQQQNLAAIVAENLAQIIDRGRLMALASAELQERKGLELNSAMSLVRTADKVYLRIALYDRQLRPLFASTPGRLNAESSAALRTLSDKPTDAEVFLLPDGKHGEQSWQIPLYFPLADEAGRSNGGLLAILDLGYFLGLYQHIEIGHSGLIHIVSRDGDELIEARREGLALKTQSRPPSALPAGAESAGSISGRLFDDGLVYLSSYQPLKRYPFTVAVSRSQDDILGEHQANRSRFFAILGLCTAAIAFAAWWIAFSLRQQTQLLAALEQADGENRQLIVRLEEEKRRAFELAAHDPLTGLPNRRMFHELVGSHLNHAKRSRRHYALMYLDLDRFKSINDSLGHHVGDLLLQAVAERLRQTLRESDVIARLGGDEFAVLLTRLETPNDCSAVAEKLIQSIVEPLLLEGHTLHTSPSIGIALYPRDGADIATLCRHADAAMYQSKQAGRSRFSYYDPSLNQGGDRSRRLEHALPDAIANGELTLHFQPRVRLEDYRIVGLEALIRWIHPELGLIYPGDFLTLAERNEYLPRLEYWVIASCCRQIADWRADGLPVPRVAINLSGHLLRTGDLPRQLSAALSQYGLHAGDIEIEIAERTLLDLPAEAAASALGALAGQGFRLTLDNAGHGISNLNHVRTLPLHAIKIAPALVGNIRNSTDDGAIVASIITLAHNMKLRVIAEHVEMLDQLVHLKTAGCDEAQGYLLSRPVAAEDASRLLLETTLAPL